MSGDRQPGRSVDIVAIVAGVVFITFSVISLTVGIDDLPSVSAAPLWVFLIGGGVLLLVSEVRGRRTHRDGAAPPSRSAEQAAWEQDTYR